MDDLTIRLAQSLYDVLYELHPVHPNTAFHSASGVGGQAFTSCCHVLDSRASEDDIKISERAHSTLREALRAAECEGFDILEA